MNLPPFPTFPAPEDWYYAARAIYQHVPSPFAECVHERLFPRLGAVPRHDDPLSRLVACARDRMRTRYRNSPKYTAFLAECDRQRKAEAAAERAASAARRAAMTAKERAEEAAFYADGGTCLEWAVQQEAKVQTKADADKARAIRRTRKGAASTPTRKRSSATAPKTPKEPT